MKFYEYVFAFLIGSFAYSMIEIISRGYTHWTMMITGGAVLGGLYYIRRRFEKRNIILRLFLGCFLITFTEFIVGVFVNIILGWNVWSYSDVPGNILGQICIPYCGAWFLLCIPADLLCGFIQKKFAQAEIAVP